MRGQLRSTVGDCYRWTDQNAQVTRGVPISGRISSGGAGTEVGVKPLEENAAFVADPATGKGTLWAFPR